MKIKGNFRLKTIGGTYLVTRRENDKENILFALNETGAFLWNGIQEGLGEEKLAEKLCAEYEAEADEVELIRGDVKEFLAQLRNAGALEEGEGD